MIVIPKIKTVTYWKMLKRVLKIIHANRTPRFADDLPRILSA